MGQALLIPPNVANVSNDVLSIWIGTSIGAALSPNSLVGPIVGAGIGVIAMTWELLDKIKQQEASDKGQLEYIPSVALTAGAVAKLLRTYTGLPNIIIALLDGFAAYELYMQSNVNQTPLSSLYWIGIIGSLIVIFFV